jgi:fibronectin type 3 domain-containing protein
MFKISVFPLLGGTRIVKILIIVILVTPLPAISDTSLIHNVGKVQMVVSDWGAFCLLDNNQVYPNFVYSGKAYLDPFSEIWVGNAQGNVASAYDNAGDADNIPVPGEWMPTTPNGGVSYVSDNPQSNQTIHAQYSPDRYRDFPYKITLDQYTYAWDSTIYPNDDEYIMVKLVLTNRGNTEIKDFYIAVQTNWDVDFNDWEDDLVDWDAQRQTGFAYDSNGSETTQVGLALISGKFASHNIVDVSQWVYLDSDRSMLMSNGEIDNVQTIKSKSCNYLNVISTGPYNISAGGSVSVVYALVIGQNLNDFRANVDSAIARAITPAKLTVSPNKQSVSLSWSQSISPDVVTYKIYRSKVSGSGYSQIAQVPVDNNSYDDNSVDKGSLSYYVVRGVTANGRESGYSNEVSSAPGVAPQSPSNLTIKTDASSKPLLHWEGINDSEITGYRIFRNSTGSIPWTPIATVDKSVQFFIDDNTYAGNTYYYTVSSVNLYNWISDYSNVVSINFPAPIKPASDLKTVKVVPQPCIGLSTIKFTNLTPMANIRIYTLDGKLIKTIYHVNNTNEEEWDLQSDSGTPLASGMYIYHIESFKPEEASKFTINGKFAIIK